tara:strand:- start:166 stop:588 length:423 start_codon:yes stop_codon:yes gene_type:complete
MTKRLLIFTIFFVLLSNFLLAKSKFFEEGLNLFKEKKYDEAKFKFEQDIVLNPKSEMSYLYLSRIFNNFKEKDLEEQNLYTVILLNPNNEDAIYYLAKLKLENSDYIKSKELNEKLMNLCNKLCEKSKKLKIEIENLSKK